MAWNDVEKTSGEGVDKTPYMEFPEGNTLFRILDDEPYSFWNHWLQKQGTGVACLGKGCPICSLMAAQKANNEPKTYSSTQRHAMRAWNYTTNRMEILIQGKTFYAQLLNLHKEIGDLKTYDVKATRKGTDTSTTYMLLPTKEAEFEHMNEVVDVDLQELLKPIDKEKVLMLLEGKTWKEIFAQDE